VPRSTPLRLLAVVSLPAAVASVLVLGAAAPANAHAIISASTTAAGAEAVLRLTIEHGCEGSPTTAVAIRLPDGISTATPSSDPRWEAATEGDTVVFRAKRPLPDGQPVTAELTVTLPDAASTLVFPTVQTCAEGELAWLEAVPDGEDADGLELPAPTLVVTGPGSPVAEASTDRASGLAVGVLGAGVLGTAVVSGVVVRRRRRS
jgi:uncharacterized protein YcnI